MGNIDTIHSFSSLPPTPTASQVGAGFAGRLADRAIIKGRLRREGKWILEDRLWVDDAFDSGEGGVGD